jgi:hypothetical protein
MNIRTFIIILLTLIFVMCVVGGIADNFDWPQWRGPNGDGISMETDWNPGALSEGPKILWKVEIGKGLSNIAIKNNYLYTTGYQDGEDIVYCLNAETGEEVWRYSYPHRYLGGYGGATQSTPIVEDMYVYALSIEGILRPPISVLLQAPASPLRAGSRPFAERTGSGTGTILNSSK